MLIIYMAGRCLKNLPVNGFRWLDSDEINEINEEFIKTIMKTIKKDIFSK